MSEYEKAHREFVLKTAKKDGKIRQIMYGHGLSEYVEKMLRGARALQGPENLPNSDPSECSKLAEHQLIKIVWLLDALEMDPEFRKSVGAEAQSDYEDKRSAHGGTIVLERGRLKLNVIPSRAFPKGLSGAMGKYENYFYDPVELCPKPNCMFLFHFHAFEEDNSRFASPTNSDLKEAERRRIDGLLFTKIIGNRFNTDFYFVGRDRENRPYNVVLDLGLYEY